MSEDYRTEAPTGENPQFDESQLQYAVDQLRDEQNLAMGIGAGVVAALAGAGIWAVVTVVTNFQIGWMAVGVGFLVGIAVRTFGKGIDKAFGIIGAALALLGCGLGNLFAVCGMIAAEQQMGFVEVLSLLSPEMIREVMIATFSPMDLLFYGIAVYEGYKLSFRQLTEDDLTTRITGLGVAE